MSCRRPTPEDLGDEVARLFEDLDRARPLDQRLLPGAFSPTLDAVETARRRRDRRRRAGCAAGRPARPAARARRHHRRRQDAAQRRRTGARASFHLVERDFGRFARAVRLNGAFDVAARHRDACAAANCASASRASTNDAAAACSSRCGGAEAPDADPVHRRHLRPAGARPRAPRPARPRASGTPSTSRSRTSRTPPPARASPATPATSCSRRGIDVMTTGQPRLGQTRSADRTSAPNPACFAR